MIESVDDREERLDQVLAEYLRAVQQGSAPDRKMLLESHPDLAKDLNEFFVDQDRFQVLALPLRALGRVTALPMQGQTIGDYELLEIIAQGGMGVVYRARQRRLGRIVALKVLRAGRLATPADRQRFLLEAEAVASLDHPGIVPIYEIGDDDGWLFFSMKMLEGGSLAQHLPDFSWPEPANSTNANLKAKRSILLNFMIELASIVNYAHQRGVLHRDLKPANVLLDETGRPLISDFGLAKYLQELNRGEAHRDPRSTFVQPLTETGTILGTPSYMAPEQAAGQRDAVTITADVYSLGAILYELLTGQPPFREESPLETLRALLETDPIAPRLLRPRVDRDLETICLKCLEKEPANRYASAHELVEDLQRARDGEAILARPIRSWERGWRWCRRNPMPASLSAGLVMMFLVGFALVVWQWQRAEDFAEKFRDQATKAEKSLVIAVEERAKAKADYQIAQDVLSNFLLRLSEKDLVDVPGLQPVRKELLEDALKYYRQFLDRHHDDPRLKADVADIQMRMAHLIKSIGPAADAETYLLRARDIYIELIDADPNAAGLKRKLAAVQLNLGTIEIALGRLDAAAASNEAALLLCEEMLENDPNDIRALEILASVQGNTGMFYFEKGEDAEALLLLQQARKNHEKIQKINPQDATVMSNLAQVDNLLGVLLERQPNKLDEALASYERGRKTRDGLVRANPRNPRYRHDLAESHYNVGVIFGKLGRHKEAEFYAQAALKLHDQLARENPLVLPYQRDVAGSHLHLGIRLEELNRHIEALQHFQSALDTFKRLSDNNPEVLVYRKDLAFTHYSIGLTQARMNKRAEAMRAYQQSCTLTEALVQANPENLGYRLGLAKALNNLGVLQMRGNDWASAADTLKDAVEHQRLITEKIPDAEEYRKTLGQYLTNRVEADRKAGRYPEAVASCQERRKIMIIPVNELVPIARDFALIASAVGEADKEKRHEYASLALDTLRQAHQTGFRGFTALKQDRSFDILRQDEELQPILATLEATP